MRRSYFAKTHSAAAKKLRAAANSQDSNLPLPSERETLGTFLDGWLPDYAANKPLRPRTEASYRMIIDRHLKPELGRVVLSRLLPKHLRDYMSRKRSEGLSARTIQYHHAVLRCAIGFAEADGKVVRNVTRLKSAAAPKVERPEVRPLTPEQAKKLLCALAESRDAPLYAVALGLGLRQGECLGLQWADLDLDAGTLTVSHTLQRYGHAYHLDAPKTQKCWPIQRSSPSSVSRPDRRSASRFSGKADHRGI